jgi:hypothetical protein
MFPKAPFRLPLLALLLIAVPLQAIAAAAGALCCISIAHPGDAQALGHSHVTQEHRATSVGSRIGGLNEHEDHIVALAKRVDHHQDGSSCDSHCASCAACCASAAIPTAAAFLFPDQPAGPTAADAPVSFAGVLLDPLDPPPLAL